MQTRVTLHVYVCFRDSNVRNGKDDDEDDDDVDENSNKLMNVWQMVMIS